MPDAPAWFEDELEPDPRPRRRLLVVVALAATSWIVLALVLVRGDGSTAAPAPAADAASGSPTDETTADAGQPPSEDDPTGASERRAEAEAAEAGAEAAEDTEAGASGAGAATDPPAVGREEAEALAVAVVRGWVSDAGPDLVVPDLEVDRRAYLEHVAIESIEVASEELAVARALLVLLVRDEEHYTEAVLRRAAIPLTITATSVHPGGPPWWLPSAPDLTPVPPATTALEDDPAAPDAVEAALAVAGYQDVEVGEVAVTASGVVVADVVARTPDGDPLDGPVWLAEAPDGLVVLGSPRAPDPPADDGPPPDPDG